MATSATPTPTSARLVVALLVIAGAASCTGPATDAERPSPPEARPGTAATGGSVSLSVPRAVHRATALQDGRILVTGGCTLPGCGGFERGQVGEIFDPVTRRFTKGPTMTTPRAGHTATLLSDGRVLLVGGYPGEGRPALPSAEVFDPVRDEFLPVGDLTVGRADHSATAMPDGTVVVAGGTTGSGDVLTSTESFDPRTNRFTPGPSLSSPRSGHSAAETQARLVLVGGTSDMDTAVTTTDVLDRGRWSPGPELLVARLKHAAIALPAGTVFVIGGAATTEGRDKFDSTEVLDLDLGRSAPGPSLADGQYKLEGAVASLPDGRVVITGGSRVEVYDPATGRLTVLSGPAVPERSFISASILTGDSVLVAGGYDATIAPTADVRIVRVPRA